MSKLISTKSNRLPSKGEPGDVFFATDTKETWIAIGDGRLFSLPVLLAGAAVVPAVGPQGETGRGEKGETGAVGRDGKNGKDSTVPGPAGAKGDKGSDGLSITGRAGANGKDGRDGMDSIVPGPKGERGERGERGEKGEPGDVTVVGDSELHEAVITLRKKLATVQASILQAMADNENSPKYVRDHVRRHLAAVKANAGL